MPLVDDTFYHSEAFSGYDSSTSPFYGKQGIYTKTEEPPTSTVNVPSVTLNMPFMDPGSPAPRPNGGPANRSSSKTVSFGDFVTVLQCHSKTEAKASHQTETEICTDLKKVNDDCINVNTDLNTTKDESQRITHSDNSESEMLNARLKRAITDHDTLSPDTMEEETDKASAVQVPTNPEDITNQHITNLEMESSPKKVVCEEERDGDSHHDPQENNTDTQNFAESPVSKEESNTSNPRYSVPETLIEKIEAAGIQDGRIEITVQDTPKQNIIAQDGVVNIYQLNTMDLDSTLTAEMIDTITELDQTISNTYYVDEDIKTSLDNVSPEESLESLSNLDASNREMNSLVATKPDMNTQRS